LFWEKIRNSLTCVNFRKKPQKREEKIYQSFETTKIEKRHQNKKKIIGFGITIQTHIFIFYL